MPDEIISRKEITVLRVNSALFGDYSARWLVRVNNDFNYKIFMNVLNKYPINLAVSENLIEQAKEFCPNEYKPLFNNRCIFKAIYLPQTPTNMKNIYVDIVISEDYRFIYIHAWATS